MRQLFLVLFVMMSCKTAQNIPFSYTTSTNEKEFKQFVKDMERNYVYLTDKRETWQCIKDKYAQNVGAISSKWEHIHFYENVLNEFYDSHTHLPIRARIV